MMPRPAPITHNALLLWGRWPAQAGRRGSVHSQRPSWVSGLFTYGVLAVLGLLLAAPSWAAEEPVPVNSDWDRLVNLRGSWKFRLGDDPGWSQAGLSTRAWESIPVPGAWEDHGYSGYDGFAWYRKRFRLEGPAARRAASEPVYLSLGRVDDIDEVWVNGHFVGSTGRTGVFYETAYFARRLYRVPAEYLNLNGVNSIAVRVYDGELQGGILEGAIGLYVPTDPLPLAVDLAGAWRFRPGDDDRRASPTFDDAQWATLTVPGRWEPQGYPDLDGHAWYRRDAEVSARHAETPMVLVLGRVDDVDEVFINGQRIGGTGNVSGGRIRGNEWEQFRAYPVPDGVLRAGKENLIAVRVYDEYIDGGIYRGPVGLMTADDYRRETRGASPWDRLMDFLADLWPGD